MNLDLLKPGHRIRVKDGREAEVMEEAGSSAAIKVCYLNTTANPFGTPLRTEEEDVVGGDEIEALVGAVPPTEWGAEVVVLLHHLPNSEYGPAEYRAETLSGVPNEVKIQGGNGTSSRHALNHLLGGLMLLGFNGRVLVEDGSGKKLERYEIELSEAT